MRKALHVLSAVLILAVVSGCAGRRPVPPLVLYPGSALPPGEIAIIRIVEAGRPSINIRKLSRVGTSIEVVYQPQSGQSWAPPDHFGGLQATQRQAPQEDLSTLPHEFHVLPGMYRVEFTYVPVVDRWGWTHQPTGENTTWLDCQPGHVYLLEGRMEEGEEGWSLVKLVLVSGEGES